MPFLNYHRSVFHRWMNAHGAFALAAVLLCASPLVAAVPLNESASNQEKMVKAVFLFNFTRFVDWPGRAPGVDKEPFVIGILGVDPFGRVLDDVVRGEKANNRPLIVKRFDRLEAVAACHVLYVSRSESVHLPAILKFLQTQPVLSVSDIDGFAESGGMIGLVTENGKVRLKVNLDMAREAHLAISSKLLRPSQLVNSPKPNASWRVWPDGYVGSPRKSGRIVRASPQSREPDGWTLRVYP